MVIINYFNLLPGSLTGWFCPLGWFAYIVWRYNMQRAYVMPEFRTDHSMAVTRAYPGARQVLHCSLFKQDLIPGGQVPL